MEIRFVGAGDAFGSGGRFQTCIRLRSNGVTALVDCGATSLTAMKSQGVDPRREKDLTVLGPAGVSARLKAAMETLYPGSTSVRRRFSVDVVELSGDGAGREAGPLTVSAWEVDHASGAPALAVRVRLDGATFAYSGDTAWTEALTRAAEGSDVFACEAYTYDRPVRYHLDYADVRDHQAAWGGAHVVLTHMGPSMLARARDVEEQTAHDGLVLAV